MVGEYSKGEVAAIGYITAVMLMAWGS